MDACRVYVTFGTGRLSGQAKKEESFPRVPVAGDYLATDEIGSDVMVKTVLLFANGHAVMPQIYCEEESMVNPDGANYKRDLKDWAAEMKRAGWEVTVHGDGD